MKKIFVDSNIMLDLSLKRQPFYLSALNLFELFYQGDFKAVTSSIAFINVSYFLNKFTPLTRVEALKRLRTVISIVKIDEEIIDLALQSDFHDFEDGVQFYAAKKAAAEIIITRNIKDYKESTIPVLTAEQFLRTI